MYSFVSPSFGRMLIFFFAKHMLLVNKWLKLSYAAAPASQLYMLGDVLIYRHMCWCGRCHSHHMTKQAPSGFDGRQAIQYNTIQRQYNTIQYNTIQYNTIQYNTIQYNTIQYNTIQYNTIQYNTIQYNTIQYNTIQYNTIQYNTIQYNTIQYNIPLFRPSICTCNE